MAKVKRHLLVIKLPHSLAGVLHYAKMRSAMYILHTYYLSFPFTRRYVFSHGVGEQRVGGR